MKLYCIIRSFEDRRFPKRTYELLKQACEARKVDIIPLESEKTNFSKLPKLGKADLLYRITIDKRAVNLHAHLNNDEVASFYESASLPDISTCGWDSTLIHQKNGLPIIPTIIDLPKSRDLLDQYVESLGGYPIIIKVEGGSHGIGVIRADSSEALYSVADYLRKRTDANAALRKYIDFKSHARLIVLGNKVIDSIEYIRPRGDFRSNVGPRPEVKVRKFSAEVNQAAIQATHALGLEFGGVDILIDKKDKFYIAEVNYPCNFARSQDITGTDISGMMVDYLISKVKKMGAK